MLAVENFVELTKPAFIAKTLANGHNTLLASKTLANQRKFLTTSCSSSSVTFHKSIRNLLRVKGLVCMAPGF